MGIEAATTSLPMFCFDLVLQETQKKLLRTECSLQVPSGGRWGGRAGLKNVSVWFNEWRKDLHVNFVTERKKSNGKALNVHV